MKAACDKLSLLEVEALKTQAGEDANEHTEIEWGVYMKLKTKGGSVKMMAKSESKVKDEEKCMKVEPSNDVKKKLEEQRETVDKGDETNVDENSNKDAEDAESTPAKSQPPPAVSVTPKNKVRAPFNKSSGARKRKILDSESEDIDDPDDDLGGFSNSKPAKKQPKVKTSRGRGGTRGGGRGVGRGGGRGQGSAGQDRGGVKIRGGGVRPRGRGKTRGGVKTRGGGKTPGGGKRGEDLIDDEDMSEESSDAPEAEGSEDSDSSSSGIDSNLASVSELSALIKPKVSRKKY
jgi:hypothetical protein